MSTNCDERRAHQWLKSQGYTDIRDLSVDGQDPPDFVVENRIGVEVRRLNWMTDANRKNQGIEELEKVLERTISEVLEEAGEPPGGYNVSVSCDLLATSLPETKEVTREQVKQAVDEYVKILDKALQSGEAPESRWAHLKGRLDMHFHPFSAPGPGRFILVQVEAATHLRGWVVKDLTDNIRRCIADKTDKIKNKVHLYPEWWLVLVERDLYSPGNRDDSWITIRNGLGDTKPWSRIVVLSVTQPSTHVDVI